jgi:hypothetical protein
VEVLELTARGTRIKTKCQNFLISWNKMWEQMEFQVGFFKLSASVSNLLAVSIFLQGEQIRSYGSRHLLEFES